MTDRILVADDDPDILRFIEVNLELEGFEIVSAVDGQDAIDKAVAHRPDLALLDVMMPKVDGMEVCRRLRDDPRTNNMSVIMLTARTLSTDKIAGLTAGADDYIIKPFDPMELIARVKSTLRRSREMTDRNPLTGLSGNLRIQAEVDRRVVEGRPFALLHIDLDHFKAYNDHYGFLRGDEAIKLTARVIQESILQTDVVSFIGHIGGDDFAVVTDPQSAETIAKEITGRFDASARSLYDEADLEAGFISVKDRSDKLREFPIMTISIGVATDNRRIGSAIEAAEIANEMKGLAKKNPESSYSIDRRGAD
ncbi:MAG TPA: response regulator [Actinomycetota bacterium]|nr:response regulator [Actinomycetota bacterium]